MLNIVKGIRGENPFNTFVADFLIKQIILISNESRVIDSSNYIIQVSILQGSSKSLQHQF